MLVEKFSPGCNWSHCEAAARKSFCRGSYSESEGPGSENEASLTEALMRKPRDLKFEYL
jgi:hypothetical protein